MSTHDVQTALDLIDDLDLGLVYKKNKVPLADNEESAIVDDGVCASFAANVTGQMKEDVMNSILLAQLAANAKYDRQTQVDAWYDEYRDVLQSVGWTAGQFNLQEITDTDNFDDVAQLVLNIAKLLLSENELPLLRRMIESLKNAINEDANKLYNNSTKSAQAANFQVGQVSSSNGGPVFKITVHSFSASVEIIDVLFFTFISSTVKFRAGYQTMKLDSSFYATVREAVLEKLGNTVLSAIDNINLE